MKTKQEEHAYLETVVFKQLRSSEATIENNGQWLAKDIRQWIRERNCKSGTRQTANHISKEIQRMREALDVVEKTVCSEPGIPFKRKVE